MPGGIPLTIAQLPTFASALSNTIIPVTQNGTTGSITLAILLGGPYTPSTNIIGTELVINNTGVAIQSTTVSQFITQAAAVGSIVGTEVFQLSPSAGSVKKSTLAQLVTLATASGNPAAADLIFSTQSGNLRASSVGQVTSFTQVLTGGGSANAQTMSLAIAPSAYYTGMILCWMPVAANTGATTVNANSLGTKSLFANGAACLGNELQTTIMARAIYDGTQFHLLNPYFTSELTIFSSNGNFTPKVSGNYIVEGYAGGGGGGGGGGSSTTNSGIGGTGGSGGSYGIQIFALTAGTVYAVVIGSGGALGTGGAASSAGNAGTAGTATTFNAVTIGAGGGQGKGGRQNDGISAIGTPGINGGGNGGGVGGNGGTNNNPGAAAGAASGPGAGGGGGGGGGTAGTAQAGGDGTAGQNGILWVRRA